MKIKTFFAPGRLGDLLSIVIGILLTFAFAPCQFYLLAILLPALLFALWQNVTPTQAFKRGWLFGLGFFGAGVYWVYISIHTFGNASALLAGFFTVGLVAILGLFPALTGYLLRRYFSYPKKALERARNNSPSFEPTRSQIFYAFPALWVFFEWVRSWICTGFPWLLLGNSQIQSPLKGYAPIVGVYGLSLLVILNSALLIQIYCDLKQKNVKKGLYYFLTLIVIWSVGAYLNTISWTHPFGKPIKVSLVQGNISQDVKWSPENVLSTLRTYQQLTKPHWNSQIVIWPESAITLPMEEAKDFLNEIDLIAKNHQTTFITGIPIQISNTQSYYNALITAGMGKGIYLKRRLVPFGEYTPLQEWFNPFLNLLKIPMSNFVSAKNKPDPLIANNIKIAAFICYEIAYPEMVLSRDNHINLLLTVSNDAWFGRSIAQAQHLEIARMRAAENGRPVLFVSNNGITAIIRANGKIQSMAPPYVAYVLTDTVQPVQGKTPFQSLGMDPILFMIVILLLIAIREQRILKRMNL